MTWCSVHHMASGNTNEQAPDGNNWFDQAMEGRSNVWLAERLGVHRSTVLRWRKGERRADGIPPEIEARIRQLIGMDARS